MRKYLDIVSNIVVIVVGIVVVGVVATKYSGLGKLPETLKPGAHMPLAELQMPEKPRTLLIFLRKGCHFCEDSLPFYKRLEADLGLARERVNILALFPDSAADAAAVLKGANLEIGYRAAVNFSRFGVSGTPTLVLVDQTGKLTQSWVGKLGGQQEGDVKHRITADVGSLSKYLDSPRILYASSARN